MKKKKPVLPGQAIHKGLKEALDYVKNIMGEIHVNVVKKGKGK